ncbi:MAG: hypothetical protein WAK03_08235 [Methylocystis sp.]|jgi:hypothetical protein
MRILVPLAFLVLAFALDAGANNARYSTIVFHGLQGAADDANRTLNGWISAPTRK